MPLTGNFAGLRRLQRSVASLAQPDGAARIDLLAKVQREIRGELAEQFAKGIGPDGQPYRPTVRGKPALISRKLPGAFASRIDRGIVRFTGKTARDLLVAHQFGAKFAARKVAAEKQHLSFNSKGKLVSERRIFKKPAIGPFAGVREVRRGAYQRFAAAHTVGGRTLPARPIYPEAMTARWEAAIKRGLVAGMELWGERAQK